MCLSAIFRVIPRVLSAVAIILLNIKTIMLVKKIKKIQFYGSHRLTNPI